MKTIILWIGAVVIGCRLATQASAITTNDLQEFTEANNRFTFKLLRDTSETRPGQNVFISPFSAGTVLQMAADGARGVTEAQIRQILGLTNLTAQTADEARKEISRALAENTNITLLTANAMWCQKNTPIEENFAKRIREYFDARVESLDFADEKSVDAINLWVNQKTLGKLPQLLSGPLDKNLRVLLMNGIYFKGKWEVPFQARDTTNRSFHLLSGTNKEVPTMEHHGMYRYTSGTNYQAIALAYEGGSMSMYVFLPCPGSRPDWLLSAIGSERWNSVKQDFMTTEGTLALPKFKLDTETEFTPLLEKSGMTLAFRDADFSKISHEPLFISSVWQKSMLEVNEEGSEALSWTQMEMLRQGWDENKPRPFEMRVDRPFLILIADKTTGLILFVGMIYEPKALGW